MKLAILSILFCSIVACTTDSTAMQMNGSADVPAPTYSSGDRIKVRVQETVITSDDGAVYSTSSAAGYYDQMRDEPCAPSPAADGVIRCLPQVTRSIGAYLDSTCVTPVALVYTANGCDPAQAPKYIGLDSDQSTTCGAKPLGPHVYLAGDRVGTQVPYYSKLSGGCVGQIPDPDFAIYPAKSGEIDPTSFAEIKVSTNIVMAP